MRLVVHIGCAKGGSSAIQRLLRTNSETLNELGYFVPSIDFSTDEAVGGQQIAFFERLRTGDELPSDFLKRVRAIADSGAHTLLISAENLCNPVDHADQFKPLVAEYETEVLMYVRRQDEYLESAWQQWNLKSGQSRSTWLIRSIGREANWYQYLAQWRNVVGVEGITVRRYGRQYLVNGDTVDDYCDAVGIPIDELKKPRGPANLSLSSAISGEAEGRPELFEGPHDNEYYNFVQRFGGDAVMKSNEGTGLFSHEERIAILERYARPNQALRSAHMPDLDDPLFEPPEPPTKAPPAKPDTAKLVELQLFNMYRELKAKGVL